ncbi:transcriptional regulator [Micrococcus sp. EYE_162]|uniref:transcriptional regulator n=1 Tax=unclassified Micrococcus TaxID=2620948 RepID=UPI00200630D0|nr:transcriptional regulator [Micrococcus sp. EYE_212]MCK6172087.1 transcriptional regulator [Micrococcus sp. EYE_162]
MTAAPAFDELIHQSTRFRICAALDSSVEMEFALLREVVEVSDSLLSKQLKALAEAGYVSTRKQKQAVGRPRTWVALTDPGRAAFQGHLAALRQIVSAPLDAGSAVPKGRSAPPAT